jgi:hypothetical protein
VEFHSSAVRDGETERYHLHFAIDQSIYNFRIYSEMIPSHRQVTLCIGVLRDQWLPVAIVWQCVIFFRWLHQSRLRTIRSVTVFQFFSINHGANGFFSSFAVPKTTTPNQNPYKIINFINRSTKFILTVSFIFLALMSRMS